jgi:hypothetical protein
VPTFSTKTNEDEENKYELPLEILSINDTTISQFVLRKLLSMELAGLSAI